MSPYVKTKGSRVRVLAIPLKANVFATHDPRAVRSVYREIISALT